MQAETIISKSSFQASNGTLFWKVRRDCQGSLISMKTVIYQTANYTHSVKAEAEKIFF
jgi:hypothetical protein